MARVLQGLALLVLLLGFEERLVAASLRVAPARFIVHNVEPGKLYDLYGETGLRLTLYNDDRTARTWMLTTHRPSERGKWERGYDEIPDADWCWFETAELNVLPASKAYGYLKLQIPAEEKYYNQHWVVTLGIDGKAGRGGLALAADVRVQIETKSKADVSESPYGCIGTVPSLVRFEGVVPGKSVEKGIVLYNGEAETRTYTIAPFLEVEDVEKATYLTSSYATIPDSRWLQHKENAEIEGQNSIALNLRLDVPEDRAFFKKKWEELLLIRSDRGHTAFVRVQIETVPEESGY